MKSRKRLRLYLSFAVIFTILFLTAFNLKTRTIAYINRCQKCKNELSCVYKTEKITLLASSDTITIDRFDELCKRCKAYELFYKVLEGRRETLKDANKFDEDGLKAGIWYEYYNDSLLLQRYLQWMYDGYTWIDGKVFDNKGIRATGFYNEDRKNGLWRYTYKNYGDSVRITYLDDTINGDYITYWPNGKMQIKAMYKNGLLDGRYYLYREDGSVSKEGSYSEGEREGTWIARYPDGSVSNRLVYRGGKFMGYD